MVVATVTMIVMVVVTTAITVVIVRLSEASDVACCVIGGTQAADELCYPVIVLIRSVGPVGGVDGDFEEFGLALAEEFHTVGHGGYQTTFAHV